MGLFIVLDGPDGTGKATQTKRLVDRLKLAGKQVETFDFPQYGARSATLVEDYLNGKFGTAEEVGPYIASLFYAADRYAASRRMKEALAAGKILVSNRYTSSNVGHQAAKIQNPADRVRFLDWLFDLEFGIFGIPAPDRTILLSLPPEIGQKLVDQKNLRQYIEGGGKRDIHEANLPHLRAARASYLEAAARFHWDVISCVDSEGRLRPRAEIAEDIWKIVGQLV